jgi:hypothetical protein
MSTKQADLDEHVRIQNQIQMLGQLALRAVDDDELQAFIDRCEHSDTVAPFLDPTAWMRGHDQLRQVIDHARALQAYRKALRE